MRARIDSTLERGNRQTDVGLLSGARVDRFLSGMSDREMAEAEGVKRNSIVKWRISKGLRRVTVVERENAAGELLRRRALYDAGLSDRAIAAIQGVDHTSIREWRHRSGRPAHNFESTNMTADQQAARLLLYSFGYSDRRIAKEQGRNPSSVRQWRECHGLKANRPTSRGLMFGGKNSVEQGMLARIRRAIPGYMSPADREDAASDLFMAVMSGAIPIDEIEKAAKKFGNRVIEQYASKWGARSLDEELGDNGDGFTMMDLIRDDRSSSWLEEMGATVW